MEEEKEEERHEEEDEKEDTLWLRVAPRRPLSATCLALNFLKSDLERKP